MAGQAVEEETMVKEGGSTGGEEGAGEDPLSGVPTSSLVGRQYKGLMAWSGWAGDGPLTGGQHSWEDKAEKQWHTE